MLRVSQSIVGEREADAIKRIILEDGYLGMGREVEAFESELAAFLGVPKEHVACVNSGTAALHLAVQAVTKPADEVLVQSLTYISSFQAISAARAVPVACEVVPKSITIDLEDAKRRLTCGTKVIMPVHYASNPGDLDRIYAFAREHGLRVIEDAAHAFGCSYKGRKIGSFGDIVCFSFDGIKNITSGEGGAVISEDPEVLAKVRNARLLGVEKDTEKRFAGQRSWEFDVLHQGYRYHMSNIFAAIGRVQLDRFPREFAPQRIALARRYRERLRDTPGISLIEAELGPVVPHIQPVRILNGQRDKLRDMLESQKIETGIHYKPNHLLSFYGRRHNDLPITEQLYKELLSLPLHPGLTTDDVDYVCNIICEHMTLHDSVTNG
jgi:dTDP-4-amino-4,6-dideoxygalactose transaminase